MGLSREQMLVEMGISPIWVTRDTVPPADERTASPLPAEPEPPAARGGASTPSIVPVVPTVAEAVPARADGKAKVEVGNLDWPALARQVAECRACALCEQRKQAVLGVGDTNPDWLFIGEGPGSEEDAKGEPFVGQAGKLLDNMLAAIGLQRGNAVYIANTVKCRPPQNRTPEPEETAACWPYLERQIELIQPKLIVALGRPAAQALLQAEVNVGAARGQLHRYRDIPVIVTYHPAYLLRSLLDKAKAWEDLCYMRATMRDLKGV